MLLLEFTVGIFLEEIFRKTRLTYKCITKKIMPGGNCIFAGNCNLSDHLMQLFQWLCLTSGGSQVIRMALNDYK